MWYFGWIPILTSTLLVDVAIRDLRKKLIPTTERNEYLYPLKVDQREIKAWDEKQKSNYKKYFDENTRKDLLVKLNLISLKEENDAIFYLRDFDDKDPNKLNIVVFTINMSNIVEDIGIFDFPEGTLNASAKITSIDSTGLVTFKINYAASSWIKQIFGEVRDLYHEHIYAPHGDFPLQPIGIEENNKSEAVSQIFYQYQEKILLYHRRIKRSLNILENRYGSHSSRHFLDVSTITSYAIGEMSYALSFINLFNLEQNQEKSINNSLTSFTNLSRKFAEISTVKSFALNWKILILTLAATWIASFQISSIIYPKHPLAISIFVTLIILEVINIHSSQSTKKRNDLPMMTDINF